MFVIKNTLVSLDIIEGFFACDLDQCKGQCCVEGDAGAPITEVEKTNIEKNISEVMPLLPPGGQREIQDNGIAYIDSEGDLVTALTGGCNCAFATFDADGLCLCALEKAYREGKLANLKPSSCFLYPIRLKKIGEMTALNLHKWKICKPAFKKGEREKTRVYQFLKEPLIREFGEEWYDELCKVAEEWLKQNNSHD